MGQAGFQGLQAVGREGGKGDGHSPHACWMEGNRKSSGDWRAPCGNGDC